MEENKQDKLRRTNRTVYDALELAETDHFPIEKLADLFYPSQLREAIKHAENQDVEERLMEAILINNRERINLKGNLYASQFFHNLEKGGVKDVYSKEEITSAIKKAIDTNIDDQIGEDKQ